ncbi:MAG TPA: SLBB domain-containing protein, partial [Vicinamibacteria bacterium]|nr:SLBB domain-containing protein [Vicinamibacteria bacterium]
QELTERLGDGYVRDPQVAVVVQAYKSSVVYVMGEVTRPGAVPLPEGRTLVEALSRAGPPTEAAGAQVMVLRARAGGAPGTTAGVDGEVIRVDLARLQAGALENNIALRAGDTVLVPRAARVFVSGRVKEPGAYPVAAGTTVRQAITMAGGFDGRAPRSVRLVRKVDGRTVEIDARMEEPLRDEDTVVVGR